jgi:hypothetical protein
VAAFYIMLYLLIYFVRAVGVSLRAIEGNKILRKYKHLDWLGLLDDIETGKAHHRTADIPKWHYANIARIEKGEHIVTMQPSQLLHVAMIATYNESREVLEPTIQSVLQSDYDMKKVILVIAYEERGGPETQRIVEELVKEYGHHFHHAFAVRHPANIPNEIIGKGGNITYAGRELQKYIAAQKIDPLRVIVTTLDADNRPDKKYFAALSYVYCLSTDPLHTSYQPVSMYTNNIWDAPAPMRVIATGNTYWNTVLALRPHVLRNFSAHAQSLAALIDTDFWSVRTIVEDGHQFWRTYFRYDGNHRVYPVYVPIYQDAVLADTYIKTLKAQFIQLRRWTWGASDIAYFADNAFAAFVPVLFNPENYAANELPIVVSQIQRVALIGALVSIYISFRNLPPKPARYKHRRTLFMLLQWVYMPITSLAYSSTAALYSQTRLMFGKYLDKFDVTVKTVVTKEGSKVKARAD